MVDREETERLRLRNRIEGSLIQATEPDSVVDEEEEKQPSSKENKKTNYSIPRVFRRCDGADIVKKNASRKKRYLMLFPGGLTLRQGARIGELEGLATRTPKLTVQFGGGGGGDAGERLQLKGFLTFPKNGLILVKGAPSAVKVIDCFDAAIVFAEWAWIGRKESNPGDVPEPVPRHVLRDKHGYDEEINEDESEIWISDKSLRTNSMTGHNGVGRRDSDGGNSYGGSQREGRNRIDNDDDNFDDDDDDDEIEEQYEEKEDIMSNDCLSDESDQNIGCIVDDCDDDDDWGGAAGKVLAENIGSGRRSMPSRSSKVDYVGKEEDGSLVDQDVEDEDEEAEAEAEDSSDGVISLDG